MPNTSRPAGVAHVPSHVLWEGCCDAVAVGEAAWTYQGSVLPHIQTPVPAHQMVFPDDLSLPLDDAAAVKRAAIPVERINGAVLLISGQDDTVRVSSRSTAYALAKYALENGSVATRYFTLRGTPAMSTHDSLKSTSMIVAARTLRCTKASLATQA